MLPIHNYMVRQCHEQWISDAHNRHHSNKQTNKIKSTQSVWCNKIKTKSNDSRDGANKEKNYAVTHIQNDSKQNKRNHKSVNLMIQGLSTNVKSRRCDN